MKCKFCGEQFQKGDFYSHLILECKGVKPANEFTESLIKQSKRFGCWVYFIYMRIEAWVSMFYSIWIE